MKPGILGDSLTYGFTPHWNAGGYCKVVDWGDGVAEDAVKSGTTLTHTYAASGTYTIRIKADCYRCMFGDNRTYTPLVYDANGNWDALGNITNGDCMFSNCFNAKLSFTTLPACLQKAPNMFAYCSAASLPLTSLPSGLLDARNMFYRCEKATLPLTSLPPGLTSAEGMFSYCPEAQLDLQELPESLSGSIREMFYHCIKSKLNFTTLPNGITSAYSTFRDCYEAELQITSLPESLVTMLGLFEGCFKARIHLTKLPNAISGRTVLAFSNAKLAEINLDELAANAPEGGWTGVTSIASMFYNAGSGNSPGTVTGSRSAFLAKLPNVTNTTNAFYGTNTTE